MFRSRLLSFQVQYWLGLKRVLSLKTKQMKNPLLLIKISLVLCLVALVMTMGDYLALHDIWHDYVSKQVIENYGGNSVLDLPGWSETKLEWQMVNVSGVFRIVYLVFSFLTLIICLKTLRKKRRSG